MREAIKFLCGSVGVYLVMAACSAERQNEDGNERSTSGGTSGVGSMNGGTAGAGASGGTSGPRDSGLMDALADAITDPVPDASADPTSGTRLKARYYAGADGSRQPILAYGWYDTLRQENCGFSAASDGSIRCLPLVGAYAVGTYFGDSACTQELAVAALVCGGPAPRYATRTVTTTCGTSSTLHELGAAYVAPVTFFKSGTTCTSLATPTGTSLFSLGAEVPPSTFVQAAEEVES